MQTKKTKRNHSEKKMPKIINRYKEQITNIIRKKNKTKTIVDKNIYISSGFKHCEYLDQNPDFCDYMEDYILTMNNFNNETFSHLFCVFDGHGGEDTAKLCIKKYPEIFKQCLNENPFDYELAIKNSYHLMDKEIEKMNLKEVGNTGTIVFINNRALYCSNVGDSSCCLIGQKNEFITIDHKCTNQKEKQRIEREGGTIMYERLDGILAISRGFGDFDLKNKGFSCEPHITKKLIDDSLKYCVLASDGVWDYLNLEDVSKIIKENENNFQNIAKIIVESAKRKASEDNICCIVIKLN